MKARLTLWGWLLIVCTGGLAIPLLLVLRPHSPPKFPINKVGQYHRSKNFMR